MVEWCGRLRISCFNSNVKQKTMVSRKKNELIVSDFHSGDRIL